MSENVHRVVYLYVHVIAYSGQLLPLRRDDPTILAPDFVRRRSFLGEAAGDNDALAVLVLPVRFLALVLQDDGDLGDTDQGISQ